MNLLEIGWSSVRRMEEAAEGGRLSRCNSANAEGSPWLEGALLGKFWT